MNYCHNCGTNLEISPINFCYGCGSNLVQTKQNKIEEHSFISYLKQNPDKTGELIDLITDEKLFKNISEIKQLSIIFNSLPKSLKLELIDLFEKELIKAKEQTDKAAGRNLTIFFSKISRRNNIKYFLWALTDADIERNLLTEFAGRQYHLYPTTSEPTKKSTNQKEVNDKDFLDLLDLFISFSSPTSAAKYILNKAKQ
ncbi:hypothetical protein [Metabacillus litoralis]|uniref:hypothetical protein n=1 Tax=Metabacillus litoralis TaxID=152268 RepID=UPI002041AA2A|nr:hypothetical protein [Metabacillus litoralis]MCM3162712.1 hypothetical protein [Metabacillus litoralis]